MIGKQDEYERMFNAERRLWWYRILHQKATDRIKRHFNDQKNIRILDAGCGTGGMLIHLQEQGFKQIEGFDYSEDGVKFSQSRGLDVTYFDLTKIAAYKPEKKFDVIICNDVFTYFPDAVIIDVLKAMKAKLAPNGIFITNNNAHAAFSGVHDIVVGGQKRFVKEDMQRLAKAANLEVTYATYWSFFLAPLIMTVRAWQRFQLKRGRIDLSKETSDVAVPPSLINNGLYWLVKMEEGLLGKGPFGSSVFVTMVPVKA
jgi:2-polyprenyl-3-methyl-5-hydroxy-6-metoxy-1,4-benzoquinol methylase